MTEIEYCVASSPIGDIWVAWDDIGVCAVQFGRGKEDLLNKLRRSLKNSPVLIEKTNRPITDEVTAYFAGELTHFSTPLHPQGSPFDMMVWQALQAIPFGQTQSYQDIARRVGNVKASRAVGNANGRNPIPLLIPCHRVIKKDGGLGGFGSGIGIKAWLLQFERTVTHRQREVLP